MEGPKVITLVSGQLRKRQRKKKQKSGFQAIYRDLEKRRVSKSSSMEHNATTTSPSLDMRTFNVSVIHSMKEG